MERTEPGDSLPSSQEPAIPFPDKSTDHELDELLEEFTERQRRGEKPTIEEYFARRPDLAADIRLLFPAMEAMEDLVRPPAEPEKLPERIGDFRILREAGRGGMGVVYEALQESLGRRVALKVLPQDLSSDAKGLERFRREARAVARLHHTNIVPIFDVGVEAGVHYYAMQYIDGRSLDVILEEARRARGKGPPVFPGLPGSSKEFRFEAKEQGRSSGANSPESRHRRAVAGVGLQVAEALAYAHVQGILHRDIKPSNLLLDGAGTVWVTDFGLAKADEEGGLSKTPTLTQAGDIVGTIAYLAPERLEGKADARSDVYALGLTLYELLTLQPAFADENRRRLLKRVADESPTPPRQLDPSIPRDLETIILTAIAREPARRYSSAARLADDLRSFLAGRPIAARRASTVERLGRWCRRQPALAALAAMVIVLLVTIATLSSFGYLKLRELLGVANANLERAKIAESQARTELRRSYIVQAHASRISSQPGRRFDCLDAVRRAAELGPSQDELRALRDEAIAALSFTDLRVTNRWRFEPQLAYAMSPDLETFAVAHPNDQEVALHRVSDQAEITYIPVEGAAFGSLRLSADGRFLAARLERGVEKLVVFDVNSRHPIYSTRLAIQGKGLAFDSHSRLLAFVSSENGNVHLVDLEERREVAEYKGWKTFGIVAMHPTGERVTLASSSDVQIRMVEARTGRPITFVDDDQGHTTVTWSADGTLLAAGRQDRSVSIFEARGDTIRPSHVLEKTRSPLVETLFNRKGTLLAAYSWDPMLRLWDPHSGDLLLTADFSVSAFSPDDRRLAFQRGSGEAGVAEVAESDVCHTIVPPPTVTEVVSSLQVSLDGRLLACGRSRDGTSLYDLETRRYVPRPPSFQEQYPLFARDGNWLLSRNGQGVQRWRILRSTEETAADGEAGRGATHGGVHFLFPETVEEAPTRASRWITQSADGQRLAVLGQRDQGEIIVISLDGTTRRKTSLGPHFSVDRISLSPDGKHLASGTWLGMDVKVWNTETAALERTIPLRRNAFVVYSPDGRWLAVMVPEECLLLDAATLAVVRHIPKPAQAGYPGHACFRKDGKVMGLSYDLTSILLLDPATGVQLAKIEAPSPLAHAIVFRPDGSHLYAAARNGSVFDWDLGLLRRELRELGVDWAD